MTTRTSIRAQSYRVSEEKIIQEQVTEMLRDSIITPLIPPWSSPVVLVLKMGGNRRICVEYRRVRLDVFENL